MKPVSQSILTLFTVLALISCNQEARLQEYLVSQKEDTDFITMDIPTSLLSGDSLQLQEDEKEALESIKKVNFLALKSNDQNMEKFEVENEKVSAILKNKKYESLMRFNKDNANVQILVEGENDRIDELIIYATKPSTGFALVRVLGKDMSAKKITKLSKAVMNNSSNLKEAAGIFGI